LEHARRRSPGGPSIRSTAGTDDSCLGGRRGNHRLTTSHSARRGAGSNKIEVEILSRAASEKRAEIRPGYGSRPTKLRITGRGHEILLQHAGAGTAARGRRRRPKWLVRARGLAAIGRVRCTLCRPCMRLPPVSSLVGRGRRDWRPCQPWGAVATRGGRRVRWLRGRVVS